MTNEISNVKVLINSEGLSKYLLLLFSKLTPWHQLLQSLSWDLYSISCKILNLEAESQTAEVSASPSAILGASASATDNLNLKP